ncbi:MAG: hypothetical protein RMJ44_04125 [Cytophagales bacterium]|nr:hypothetical protein [Bernardetiaceae bacterium]MDW8210251.1 hypothetical protein [Cytophagales bacterium]
MHWINTWALKGLLLLAIQVQGQTFSRDMWHEGEANLFSGETLRGKLKYDLDNNSLQISTAGVVRSFSSYQVESFEIFDELQKVPRTFFTLPYRKSGNYEAPFFFELLYEGKKLTLLNREVFVQRIISGPTMWGWWGPRVAMGTTTVQADSYYLLDMQKEQVIKVGQQRSDWLALMKDFRDEMNEFIRTNKLSFTQRADVLKIIAYYDQLVQTTTTK